MTIYSYLKSYDVDTGGSYEDYYPIHTHLCIEYGTNLYFVPFQNTLTIVKLDCTDGSISLIATKTSAITKFYFDRANDKLYFIHSLNTIDAIDLTDDSLDGDYSTDISGGGTLGALEDIIIYDSNLFVIDTSQDDLTYYKFDAGDDDWDAVGTIAEGKDNYYALHVANTDPQGMCWDGTYFYVCDPSSNLIYKYDSSFSYIGTINTNTISGGANFLPTGITTDGSSFYVVDYDDASIYKYNGAFDTLQETYDIGALGGNDAPWDICWDGSNFFVTDNDNFVYKYPPDFASLITSYDIGGLGGNDDIFGIEWDGNFFFITDDTDDYVYKYDSSFLYIIDIYDIGALGGNDNPYGITWDGSFFYVVDSDDIRVYQYSSDLNTELGKILYSVVIDDDSWVVYQYITGDCKIYAKDLDGSDNPILKETLTSGYIIPYLEDQRGLAVSSDDDTLSFVLKKTSDGLTYFCTYSITDDEFTVGGEFNVAIMLNRNSDESNAIPFNTEKSFGVDSGVNDLMIYQIIERGSPSNRLKKIADLNNIRVGDTDNYTSGYVIKAITDTYLIIQNSSTGASELWTFQSMSTIVFSEIITHTERDYPIAQIQYDSAKLNITEGMFIQIIGTFKGVANQVLFEGYVTFPEDNTIEEPRLKNCSLISQLLDDFANNYYSGTEAAARTDQHLNNIITASCNYAQNGTQSNGSNIAETPYKGNVVIRLIANQLAAFDEFTWYSSPTGAIDFDDGSVDSGVDYADNSAPKVYNVVLKRRDRVYNKVDIEGAYVNGAKIVSTIDGENKQSQDQLGIQRKTVTIPYAQTAANCNTWAQSICNLLSSSITIVEFTVKDTTNGMLQPGEEITLTLANNPYRTISAAQYHINSIMFNARTGLARYIASSSVYYQHYEFEKGLDTNSENINQISTYVSEEGGLITKTGWDITEVQDVLTLSINTTTRVFSCTPSEAITYYIQNAEYTISAAQTVTIDDTEGLWFIYFVGSTLTASQTPWVITDSDKCFVAIVYWDAANNDAQIQWECHGWQMDASTHEYNHDTFGMRLDTRSGGLILTEGGTATQVVVTAGTVHDEDIEINITSGAGGGLFEQDLSDPAQIPVYYQSGATGTWRWYTTGDYPYYDNATADNVHYNSYSAPNWSSTAASTAAKYVSYYIFATNNISEPIISIMGQREDNTEAEARLNQQPSTLTLSGLPSEEMKILYQLIFKSNSTNLTIIDYRQADSPGGVLVPIVDADAIHVNVAGEIAAITAKGTPVTGDYIVIEDSADSNNKKSCTLNDLPIVSDLSDLEDTMEAYLAIGSANKKYKTCILENVWSAWSYMRGVDSYTNSGSSDFTLCFAVPLDPTLGSKKLYIDSVQVGIEDADANDYVDRVLIKDWLTYNTHVSPLPLDDSTNRTASGEYDYDFTAHDFSSSKRIYILVTCVATTASELDVSYVRVQYYYDD